MQPMAFDLRRALLRKEEHESARLMEFEFLQRARTFRLLAEPLEVDADAVVKRIAHSDDDGVLGWLADETKCDPIELRELANRCAAQARKELIREIGDPTPNRFF
jgi:hypothetical protein